MSDRAPHVVLFDPYLGGHHGQYLAACVRHWLAHELPGRLDLLVARGFREAHAEVASVVEGAARPGLRLLDFGDLPPDAEGAIGLARADLSVGRRLAARLDRERPTHAVLMYFDHLQLALARGLRFSFPLKLSGIYFRPSFHYAGLRGARPALRDRIRDLRKRMQLAAALRNPHLDTLLSLDPYVVPHLRRSRRVRAVHLPEPVETAVALRSREFVREQLGVDPSRIVAVLPGTLCARKGVLQTLEAVVLLPQQAQRRLCLLLAGPVSTDERASVMAAIERARSGGALQVILEDRFIEELEFDSVLAGSDLVLVPYQRHIGSSGVLVRAAAAGLPVIGSDYGLVGAEITRHRLGLAVDATKPADIARALERAVNTHGDLDFDVASAKRYAAGHTRERFAAAIFAAAGLPSTPLTPTSAT